VQIFDRLSDSGAIPADSEETLHDSILLAQGLISAFNWIEVFNSLPTPANELSHHYLLNAIEILNRKLSYPSHGVYMYRGLLRISSLRYRWISGEFSEGNQLCSGNFDQPLLVLRTIFYDLADIIEDFARVIQQSQQADEAWELADSLRDAASELYFDEAELIEILRELESHFRGRVTQC
jgi:hypothetical protein